MDYIVFGTGYGATLLLLGWALRTFGPGLRYQDAGEDAPASADVLVRRVGWTRFAEALGAVVATAGAAVILVTFITALINPGNRAGAIVLWICFALVVLGAAVWLWFYVARYGAGGLVPERLDIARLFDRGERPSMPSAGPAPVFATSNPGPGDPDSLVAHDTDFDEDDYDPVVDDEFDDLVPVPGMEDDAGMTFHASRYQVHRSDDEEDEDDAHHALFAMYGAEDSPTDGFDAEDEPADIDEPEADLEPEEATAGDTEPVESAPDAEADDPNEGDADDPGAADVAADDDDDDFGDDPDVEEDDLPDGDGAGEPVLGPDAPLADTPEGRAEALRRIQEWHPGEDVS